MERREGRVSGKVAVITGSTYGIGKAIAEVLAEEGATVIITGRSKEKGRNVAENIREDGGKAEYMYLDVTKEEVVKDLFDAVHEKYNDLDILVNNAGINGPNKPTHHYTQEEWDRVFDVNVKGAFLCTKYAVPYLKMEGGGTIIYMSSIYGIVGAPDVPAYHATKAALRNMAKIDALIYAEDNIRVNSVHPGFIWTPMVEGYLEEQAENLDKTAAQLRDDLAARHPIGHIGEPEDIAYGVLYLVSDEAKFVTGSELVIDGGYTAR